MRNPLVYMKNVIWICLLKIRYPNALSMGWIQSFDRLRIEISNGGKLMLGSYNQNREKLFIVVAGGILEIGSHCFFNINSSITCMEQIKIGNNCKFGNNLVIIDHDHNYKSKGNFTVENPEFISSPIRIGNNVWCGANVTILKGTEIGDNCVIAAGSVIKGVFPNETMIIPRITKIIKDIGEGVQ